MGLKKGDNLICLNTIKNPLGWDLFEKDKVYTVLYVNNETVIRTACLNHKLYANEYSEFDIEWINKNFKKNDERKDNTNN